MSLTSNLRDKHSPIRKLFDENFSIDSLLNNQELLNLPIIKPKIEKDYPWAIVGHIVEYILDIHLGSPIERLMPMVCLKELCHEQYKKILSFGITKDHLNSDYHLKGIISVTLYHLALYEGEVRTKVNPIYKNNYNGKKIILPEFVVNDIVSIYHYSIKNFNFGNYLFNPVFDKSLTKIIGGADADLIKICETCNCLIDIKTTKFNKIEASWIYQLLGYVALDYYNLYNLRNIAIYMPRQNYYIQYSIDNIIQLHSKYSTLEEFRMGFSKSLIQ